MSDATSHAAAARRDALDPVALSSPTPSPGTPGRRTLGRRQVLSLGTSGLLVAALAACGNKAAAAARPALIPERDDSAALAPKDARKRLEDGNARFVAGLGQHPDQSAARRKALADGEAPFAAVLCCSDSRVPPELAFDQGLGDLYVVRSAGPVLDKAVLGSLQFGISQLEIPLLVVLGHTACSAITATIDAVKKKTVSVGSDFDTVIDALRPAVVDAIQSGAGEDLLAPAAVSNNVDTVVTQLKTAKVVEGAVKAGKLRIIGGVFDMDTGEVTFS